MSFSTDREGKNKKMKMKMKKESSSMANGESNPNFFKIYFPRLSSKRLKIPMPFSTHIRRETSRIFFLMGPSGSVWTVHLTQNVDGYFFEEGWPVFVRDHLMQLGDILVFVYEGNSNFSVEIFDPSGCEKQSAFHAICSQECARSRRDKGEKKGCNEAVNVLNPSSYESRRDLSKRKGNMEANDTQVADVKSGSITSQRCIVTWEEKERAFQAAMKFRSKNPFTVIVMRPSYVYSGFCLPMPSSFKNFHLPDASRQMILKDPSGTTWPVCYIVYSTGSQRGVLSGGWNAFSFHNNIEEDDACIFELIEKDVMQVHIFRVVEKITPLIKHLSSMRLHNYESSNTILID